MITTYVPHTAGEVYSEARKYVDSWSANQPPTAAGEDCILASAQCPSNCGLYYKTSPAKGAA
ncbi:MAG: hypothetical protein OXN27_16080 [Candidatus Poribacteria bacterium]|nr:hypothetical protein [Candidatus Poribacteria bacterium]MDE0325431.1 hypothetical protein [Candidatus Poribacteria bacterium]